MNNTIILLIAGMALVTYIPRMIPLTFLNMQRIPLWFQRILRNVPYAALGALIFPSIFLIHENILYGVIGGVTAFILAYFGANLMIVVLSSIIVLTLCTMFFF